MASAKCAVDKEIVVQYSVYELVLVCLTIVVRDFIYCYNVVIQSV